MNYFKTIFSTSIITFLFLINGFGQTDSSSEFFHKKRFNAGFAGGINVSELGGDEGLSSNFGYNIGVFGIADLTLKMHLSIELLWSQNGDYLIPAIYPNLDNTDIKLNFVEVPLQLNYRLRQNNGESNNFGWLRFGVGYAHLVDYSIFKENINVTSQVVFENENAFLVNFGGLFFLNQHLGIDIKMSLPVQAEDLTPTIAFRGIYLL